MVYKYWLNILGRSHEAGLNLVRPEFPHFSSSRMKCGSRSQSSRDITHSQNVGQPSSIMAKYLQA